MLRKIFIPILCFALIGGIVSCNTKTEDVSYEQMQSVQVSGFYLSANSKVLDSLQNVFFSIDLVNFKIFNADSLPYGTNVSRLIPKITTPANASAVTLTYFVPEANRDSVVNYLTNSTDTIDFSGGPVKLTVVSQNGSVKRDYEIKVNVHQVKSDSLVWYRMESAPLPSSISKIKAQGFAVLDGTYYCLTTDGTLYCLASTKTPDNPSWQSRQIKLAFNPDIESLRYSADAAYMLDVNGNLYKSTDLVDWTSTGCNWHYIYGGYGAEILGSQLVGQAYKIAAYPSGQTWDAPVDFPVENTSVPSFYILPMGYSTQSVMLGGRCADGSLTNAAWGFDGTQWVNLSVTPLPHAMEDITLVPYRLVQMLPSTWSPQSYPVLLAFGGRVANGAVNRTVYYSRDWGMTWKVAPKTVQLPQALPAFYRASGFDYSTTMHVDSRAGANRWSEIELPALQPFQQYIMPADSRAVAPVTQWQCPSLYLLGGRGTDGEPLTEMWRGVITEFTFVPVQ